MTPQSPDPEGTLYVIYTLVRWRREKHIIAWLLYRGSIPLYDYSLGVRVHPPYRGLNLVHLTVVEYHDMGLLMLRREESKGKASIGKKK